MCLARDCQQHKHADNRRSWVWPADNSGTAQHDMSIARVYEATKITTMKIAKALHVSC